MEVEKERKNGIKKNGLKKNREGREKGRIRGKKEMEKIVDKREYAVRK